VGHGRQGGAVTVSDETSIEQRHVESLAVERDQGRARLEECTYRREQSGLLRRIAHEELSQAKRLAVEAPDANQERVGACAAGQPRGLGVQEGQRIGCGFGDSRITGPLGKCPQRRGVAQRRPPVPVIGGVALFDDKRRPAGCPTELSADHLLNRVRRARVCCREVARSNIHAQRL